MFRKLLKQERAAISFFFETMGVLAFFLLIIHAPLIIQTMGTM